MELHETFRKNKITIKKPNHEKATYRVKRYGWGYFDIPIKIYWKKWLKRKPDELEHTLHFEGPVEKKCFVAKFDKKELPKKMM